MSQIFAASFPEAPSEQTAGGAIQSLAKEWAGFAANGRTQTANSVSHGLFVLPSKDQIREKRTPLQQLAGEGWDPGWAD